MRLQHEVAFLVDQRERLVRCRLLDVSDKAQRRRQGQAAETNISGVSSAPSSISNSMWLCLRTAPSGALHTTRAARPRTLNPSSFPAALVISRAVAFLIGRSRELHIEVMCSRHS